MNLKELKEQLEKLYDFLLTCEGQIVEVQESISMDTTRGYDRHVTVNNSFSFSVKRTGWQMSGGHIYLYGEKSQFGFFTKTLESLEIEENQLVVIEKFEDKTARKSVIRILEN